MLAAYSQLPFFLQVLFAGVIAWLAGAVGSAFVFLQKRPNQTLMDGSLGFAGGVMVAASVWSLIIPGIDMVAEAGGGNGASLTWLPVTVGFVLGAFFIWVVNNLLPHSHLEPGGAKHHGPGTELSKSRLLFLAMTLHNFPEGLSIGVAFGSVLAGGTPLAAALALTLGLAIQNVPEGIAVATAIKREGQSSLRSFNYGQFSGAVEIVAALIGALFASLVGAILPYALGFAAGAMMFVVFEDIIPESQANGNHQLATLGSLVGFVLMMLLDISLG